jgi:hypothetical protein
VMKRYRIIHNFVCSQQTISGMQDLIPGDHCESGKFSCLISPVRVGCASIHHSRLPFKRCITVLVQCIRVVQGTVSSPPHRSSVLHRLHTVEGS